jgi:pyruvate dehydrogenase E1 component beta subunit
MAVMTMVQAIQSALAIKLAEDDRVVVYGEDVGVEGGVFRVTQDLQKRFTEDRVFDTPLAESAIIGTAVGMCIAGLRPVVEIQFSGFIWPGFNQLVAHAARYNNRSQGRYPMPMVVRTPYGGGVRALEHHSDSEEAYFAHTPGLKVIIPATPHDAKGLLISAIESDDPVVFMEPKRIYRAIKQEVSEDRFSIPIGKAKVVSEGDHITVVSYGAMVREVQKAMVLAAKAGIRVELVDLRTIYPLDREAIAGSVKKTGRLLVVSESPSFASVASEVMASVTEDAFLSLEAPPSRLTGFDTVIPLPHGEQLYLPEPERIFHAIKNAVEY